jgi:hypothetical protein
MTSIRKALWIGTVLAAWTAPSPAADRPVISVESGVFSQYVSRGMLSSNGPVLQNSATVLWRGAHLNLWTNLDLNSANGRRGKFDEVDYDAGYDRSMEKVSFSAGAIRYAFPNTTAAPTTEVYAGAALAVPLRPAVKAYYDVDGIRGTYVTFDVSHSVALPEPHPQVRWSVELAAGAGWGSSGYSRSYFGVHEQGLMDLHPGLAVPVNLGKRCRVTPRISYAVLARKALRDSGVPAPHGFVAGVTVGFTL